MSRSSARRQAALVAAAGVLGVAGVAAPVQPASAGVPSSTTLVLSAAQSEHGAVVSASAAVVTASGPGEGAVVLSVDGVAYKAPLGADGTAGLLLPRARAGTHTVQATFLPQDPLRQDGSVSEALAWQVVPARTRLRVRVSGKRARTVTAVHVRATGDHGTTPSGRVRVVVRRSGRAVRVGRGRLESGAVVARVGRLRPGRYRVEVTYRGDADHLRQRRVERFRVRKTH